MLCGDLEGWQGEGSRGDICIQIAGSLCYSAETNTTLQSNCTPIKTKEGKKEIQVEPLPQNDRTRIQYIQCQHPALSVKEPWSRAFLEEGKKTKTKNCPPAGIRSGLQDS